MIINEKTIDPQSYCDWILYTINAFIINGSLTSLLSQKLKAISLIFRCLFDFATTQNSIVQYCKYCFFSLCVLFHENTFQFPLKCVCVPKKCVRITPVRKKQQFVADVGFIYVRKFIHFVVDFYYIVTHVNFYSLNQKQPLH